MTTVEEQIEEQETEAAERPLLVRSFVADVTPGDGRTVDVRIVPYGEQATVHDGLGGLPRGVPYQEEWMPGVFEGQVRAANRVLANVEHERGLRGIVGHGLELREAADGFHGSFRLHENEDGEKALMLVREGVFEGISLEAIPKKNVRSAAGVIQRVKATLRGIAFCREGAFPGARVLAVREQDILDEELLLPDIDPELVERCRRAGIRLPQRFEAPPDETDPPAETGTSADGTRPPDADDDDNSEVP